MDTPAVSTPLFLKQTATFGYPKFPATLNAISKFIRDSLKQDGVLLRYGNAN